jgi:hypothetical protein
LFSPANPHLRLNAASASRLDKTAAEISRDLRLNISKIVGNLVNPNCQPFRLSGIAFPNCFYAPSHFGQSRGVFPIAFHIRCKFRYPVTSPAFWIRCQTTIGMLMPEAAMDENRELMAWQHQIGLPRQIAPVKPKAKTLRM